MPTTYDQHKTILAGQVLIFTLATSKNKKWQCRFKNPLGKKPRYIRKSLDTVDESIAVTRAHEIFTEYTTRAHLGLKQGSMTVTELYETYSYSMSQVMRNMTRMYHATYWLRYFGDRDITRLQTSDITEYFRWRVEEYTSRDENGSDVGPSWRASDDTISFSTLKAERQALSYLFRKAYADNVIARQPSFPEQFHNWEKVHKLPANNRRGRFTMSQYRRLMADFSDIAKSLRKDAWKPVLLDPEQPFDPEENPYISIAKRDVEEGRESRSPIYTSTKRRYPKAVYWFSSLLLAQTGIRVSELVKLRHSDISLVKDEDGAIYTVINIRATVSKVRKQRMAIASDGSETYRRYLTYKKELQYFFNRHLDDNDYIFPQPNGENYYIGPREKLAQRVRTEFKRLNLHTALVDDTKGNRVSVMYTAYSFRSWYITQRLANGLDLYTLSLNCGVSIPTLVATYAKNTTWQFRDKMTKHLHANIELKEEGQLDEELQAELRDWTG